MLTAKNEIFDRQLELSFSSCSFLVDSKTDSNQKGCMNP